ncbi:hypothetical protein L249_5805 [Ophiocordyceps polyrhachis-furcata BCC 54312]|uniref:Uncharacterized protein n=1 Tax=Ophiocordyceps polyrhachis-furcata BCC 54312 TaxID=1330021 RepID=A0A367L0V8_9HYPO|nr:hypothetical protein L249_5805 [Ophiocordyceps polyrhachis-furcata BCC 54312]
MTGIIAYLDWERGWGKSQPHRHDVVELVPVSAVDEITQELADFGRALLNPLTSGGKMGGGGTDE